MASLEVPTAAELSRIKQQLLTDKSPSSRQQSYQFVYWRQLGDTLGQPFDSTKIPISKLYQMRRDPMLAFALHFIKTPLIKAEWYIKADDAQVAAFVDYSLRKIYARFILQYCLSLDFGFSAVVKRWEQEYPTGTYIDPNDIDRNEKRIWDEGNVPATVWKNFTALPPEQVEPRWNTNGEFNGIKYDVKKDIPLAFPNISYTEDDSVNVPLINSLWITNEKDSVFGSPWGYPRIGYAFRYWWSYWYRWALADRHFEKDADPAAIVRYPKDPDDLVTDDSGNIVDYREIALGIGEQARSGSTIAMPSDLIIGNDVDQRATNTYKWDIKFLEGGQNFEVFDKTFERLEVLKLRSVFLPEQAFVESASGSGGYNVARTLIDSFQESQAVLMAEVDDTLNRWVIPQLVEVNFPEYRGRVEKITKGFGNQDLDLAKEIIQWVGQKNPEALEVDFRTLLGTLGMPMKSAQLLQAERERAIQEAMALQPPATEAAPGQAGVVQTDTGFKYIEPRQTLFFSDSDPFLSSLPDTDHYKDADILNATHQNWTIWRETFGDAYNSFAQYVESSDLTDLIKSMGDNLSEDKIYLEDNENLDSFINRWKFSFDKAIDKTLENVKKIMTKAGRRELRRSKLSTEKWNSQESASDWASRHAGSLVKGIDDTVRKELRTFIAGEIAAGHSNEEIANNIRNHFSTFPRWKADRLARTETMLAYNFATLIAAESAGITKVQAKDGQRGPTDDVCERRNGKIFSIPAAMKENLVEHPNGTLSWRLLRQSNLSVEKLPREAIEGDRIAWYDPYDDTIYMAQDISPEDEESYMLMIGERLCDS